jgi:hypothetical protein
MKIKINVTQAKITLLFCLLFTINTYSQNYIGLSGRVGLYKVSANTQVSLALKPGVGIDFLHQFNNHLRFTTGAYFSPLGFKQTFISVNNAGEIIGNLAVYYNLNYVSVPLLIGYTFGFDKLNLYSNVGIAPAYLLNVSYKVNDTKMTPLTGEFNSFDISAMFNLGAEFKLGDKLLLNTDLNINKGLLPISDTSYSSFKESRNMGLFISLGLKYKL